MLHTAVAFFTRWRNPATIAIGAFAIVLGLGTAVPATTVEAAVITFEVELIGANEVPAASSPASGLARFTFNDQTGELTYAIWARGVSSNQITASHIHKAPVGVAGPPVYTLATGPFDSLSGSIMLTAQDIADLKAGNLYVNFHTTSNPPGAARGQLILPLAAPSPISPPSTGDGGLLGHRPAGDPLGFVVAAALLAGGLGVFVREGRRAP